MANIIIAIGSFVQVLRNINEAIGATQTIRVFIEDDLAELLDKISDSQYEGAIRILKDILPGAANKSAQIFLVLTKLEGVYDLNSKEIESYKPSFWSSFIRDPLERQAKIYDYIASSALLISFCYQYPHSDVFDNTTSHHYALIARETFYKCAKITVQQSVSDSYSMEYKPALDQLTDAELMLISYCQSIGIPTWKAICNFQEISEKVEKAETTVIPRRTYEHDSSRQRYGGGFYRTKYIPLTEYKTVTIKKYKLMGQWNPPS